MSRPEQLKLHIFALVYEIMHHMKVHLKFHLAGIFRALKGV